MGVALGWGSGKSLISGVGETSNTCLDGFQSFPGPVCASRPPPFVCECLSFVTVPPLALHSMLVHHIWGMWVADNLSFQLSDLLITCTP